MGEDVEGKTSSSKLAKEQAFPSIPQPLVMAVLGLEEPNAHATLTQTISMMIVK